MLNLPSAIIKKLWLTNPLQVRVVHKPAFAINIALNSLTICLFWQTNQYVRSVYRF